jgi:hypothetical protein
MGEHIISRFIGCCCSSEEELEEEIMVVSFDCFGVAVDPGVLPYMFPKMKGGVVADDDDGKGKA